MGFPREDYWNGVPFPPPGDLPSSGIEPTSLTSPALTGGFFTTSATWEALSWVYLSLFPLAFCFFSFNYLLSLVRELLCLLAFLLL